MARVVMYEAQDGTLYKTHAECARRDAELKMLPELQMLVGDTTRFPCDGGVFEADDRGEMCLYPENLAAWLTMNADALRAILNDNVPSKRGVKVK